MARSSAGPPFRPGRLRLAVSVAALIAVVLLVAFANASDSDVASQFTLLFLLTGGVALGYLWGRLWWIPGIVLGVTVAAQHLLAVATERAEPTIHLPPGWLGTASLLILLIPALLAALGGALIRRRVQAAAALRAPVDRG